MRTSLFLVFLFGLFGMLAADTSQADFVRGDANLDRVADLSDAYTILGKIFVGSADIECEDAADVDDNGTIDLSDIIRLLLHLFIDESVEIPIPYPTPGTDPTPDLLSCGLEKAEEESTPVQLAGPFLAVDFNDAPLGPYAKSLLRAHFPGLDWASGLNEGRVTIIEELNANRAVRIYYPMGGVGPAEGGSQWSVVLGRSYDELYLSYRVKFGENFDFVNAGKLPGYAGGKGNTGGLVPDGRDGWSARLIWRAGGKVAQYVYHPDQPSQYGEDLPWEIGGQRFFRPGVWHRVEHRIVMNTPGQRDGIIQGWFDGELSLDRRNLRFRDVDTFAIDRFYFSTFFGGMGAEWAPRKDEYVFFDDFVFSEAPITH